MAGDGTIEIDLDVNDNSDSTFDSFKQKAKNVGKDAHDKLQDEFGKEVVAKLDAQAKEAGINNFSKLLKDLPREKQVELLAKAEKGKVIDFDHELEKLPAKVVTDLDLNDHASVKMKSMHEEAGRLSNRFSILKGVLFGTFAGNLVSSAIGGITDGLKEATKAGMEFNKEQDTMRTVWHSLTEEAPNDGKVMVDYINQMSQHSIYAADSINKMAQSFYHVHSNVDETKRWTNSFIALGSTMHMTNDQLSEAGEQFAKIVAGGKASQEDLNVMINRFPMFGEAIQKATGKSMQQLQQLSQQGKLSATDFTAALDYLGNKYKDGTAEAMTSMQGMTMYLQSRFSKLSGDVMKSSFNMSKSATSAIQEITSDQNMEKYAQVISDAFGKALGVVSQVITYIKAHGNDIVSILGSIMKIAGGILSGAWQAFANSIKLIGSMFGSMGKSSDKSKDSLHQVSTALDAIAKHQGELKVFGSVLAAAFATKKLADFVGALRKVNDTLKITGAISGAARAIGTYSTAVRRGTSVLSSLRFTLVKYSETSKVAAVASKTLSIAQTALNASFRLVKGGASAVVSGFGKMITAIKESTIVTKAMSVATKAWNLATKTMTAAQIAFNAALDANPIGLVIIAIAAVIGVLVTLYTQFKPFRDVVNTTIKGAVISFKYLANVIGDVLGDIPGIWNSVWGGVSSFFSGIWDNIVGTVEKAIDKIKGIINGVKDIIGGIGKGISKMIPHFATGGIVGQNDQIVMVNDGTGADWKELIHLPSGELMMSNERNALMPLPIGTRIYSGTDTKEIMKKQGINNYENGGYVGQKPFNLAEKLSNTVNGIKNSMNSISGNPMIAGVGGVQMAGAPQGGGIDLSGDTKLIINLDSDEIATKTWPKIKMLQNLDVQTTGMARGSRYDR